MEQRRQALCAHRSCPGRNRNQPVPLAEKSPAGGPQRPGNALRPAKRKLHNLRSNLQPPGTLPRLHALQAGRGRNRERGLKLGLGDNLDSPTLGLL